jgi:hypothetical protein
MNIEPLEARIAPAVLGIGTGHNLAHATFFDADGDLVTVQLLNAPADVRFDIALVGDVPNGSDIASIQISDIKPCNGTATDSDAVLSIVVNPKKLGDGGFGPGFTEIGTIDSALGLAGISLRSAAADQINVTGDLDALKVDFRPAKVKPFLSVNPREVAAFGSVDVTGDVGRITLRSVADVNNDLPGNDITGAIGIGGNLGKLIARFSNVRGAVTVGGNLTTIAAVDLEAALEVTGFLTNATFNHINASITVGGFFDRLRAIEIASSISGDNIGIINAASMRGATINATAGIGEIFVVSHIGDAISDSTITAERIIGIIIGRTTSTADGANGMVNSIFRAGENIALISASTADPAAITGPTDTTHGAIVGSGFDAQTSIGRLSTIGHINNSVFVAGINLGTDFNTAGAGTFTGANPFGFGGATDTHNTSIPEIGVISVGTPAGGAPGSIGNSTFLAGIIGAGSNASFGESGVTANPDGSFKLTQDDTFLEGSAIGSITVAGNIRKAVFEAGVIASHSGESITAESIGEDDFDQSGVFIAVDPAGSGLGSVTATLPLTETTDSPDRDRR